MANELTIGATFSFTKNGSTVSVAAVSNKRRDVAGDIAFTSVQNIGTSEEAIDVGTAASLGYIRLRNLDTDATKYIRVGTQTTVYQIRLYGGDVALFRGNNGTTGVATGLFAIANATAQNLEIAVVEP